MARGYPEPKESDAALPDLVGPDTCPICKKRPRAGPGLPCGRCAALLSA